MSCLLFLVVVVVGLIAVAPIPVAGALALADGAELFLEEAGGIFAGGSGEALGVDRDRPFWTDPDLDVFVGFHERTEVQDQAARVRRMEPSVS